MRWTRPSTMAPRCAASLCLLLAIVAHCAHGQDGRLSPDGDTTLPPPSATASPSSAPASTLGGANPYEAATLALGDWDPFADSSPPRELQSAVPLAPPHASEAGIHPILNLLAPETVTFADWFTGGWRVRHFAGEDPSVDESFTSVEFFQGVPIGQGFWFVDGRGSLTNDAGLGGNIGSGYRHHVAPVDWVLGVNVWFDVDDRNQNFYRQVGAGLEAFNDTWTIRSNVYVPVGTSAHVLGYSPLSPEGFFQGYHLLFPRTRFEEVALHGVDLEIGARLPGAFAADHDIHVAGGWYHFSRDNGPSFSGPSLRVEADVLAFVNAQFRVTHDDQFGTSAQFALTWTRPIGGTFHDVALPATARSRLPERVQRNYQIVVVNHDVFDPVTATDPDTGNPWHFIHADSQAAQAGDGTAERPFAALANAEAASAPKDILYLHADSDFSGQSLAMKQQQRLLGEGQWAGATVADPLFAIVQDPNLFVSASLGSRTVGPLLDAGDDVVHLLATEQFGPRLIAIPRATNGTALPRMSNAPTNAVGLASDTEVSGIRVRSPGNNGLSGTQLQGNVNLNRNILDSAGNNAVAINNSTANITIAQSTIRNSANSGVQLQALAGTNQIVRVFQNTLDSATGVGVAASGFSGPNQLLDIDQNSIANSPVGVGINAFGAANATSAIRISQNQVDNTGTGISVSGAGQA